MNLFIALYGLPRFCNSLAFDILGLTARLYPASTEPFLSARTLMEIRPPAPHFPTGLKDPV